MKKSLIRLLVIYEPIIRIANRVFKNRISTIIEEFTKKLIDDEDELEDMRRNYSKYASYYHKNRRRG